MNRRGRYNKLNDSAQKPVWVAASKVGRAAYCPKYLELEQQKTEVSRTAQAARVRGELKHDQFNKQAQDTRCFVATHVYGIDDPRTVNLRNYRDNTLTKTLAGRCFIRSYYALSPFLIRAAKRLPLLDRTLKTLLNVFYRRVVKR